MTGTLICYDGRRLALPVFSGWQFRYTGGVPCDSFQAVCPWVAGMEPALADANRFVAEENGERFFTGVLDEYQLDWDSGGGRLSLSGRGLAAMLLDNEAVGADYQVATEEDILRDHVRCYGVPVGQRGRLPAVPNFSVETGESEWSVLHSFARYHNGVQPRFDRFGSLSLTPVKGRTLTVDDKSGVLAVRYRDRRYGVLSEIVVRDRGLTSDQYVANRAFQKAGGCCRRVITMPSGSDYQTMRYSGQFQLDRSAEERVRVELVLPGRFTAWPGDRVQTTLSRPRIAGTWTVLETMFELGEDGSRTTLRLG